MSLVVENGIFGWHFVIPRRVRLKIGNPFFGWVLKGTKRTPASLGGRNFEAGENPSHDKVTGMGKVSQIAGTIFNSVLRVAVESVPGRLPAIYFLWFLG